jgi:starch-binding outer membrane protein, SusD/RagB family
MPLSDAAPRGRPILVVGAALACLFAGGTVACNPGNALKIATPDNISPNTLNNIGGLAAYRGAVLSHFQVAYSGAADEGNGGHEGYINFSGLFTDEMEDMETFPTRILVDGRVASGGNASLKPYFIDMTTARSFADQADAAYNQFAPDSLGHGIVLALGGYSYIMFAEMYCEGVPVSTLNANGSITYGQPLTRNQLLAIALQRFDSAEVIARDNGDSSTINLARIGAGRALLDSNDDADAALAVAGVPESYVYQIGASVNSALENNGIWNYTFGEQGFSVSDSEGTNGLPFFSANDPRVPVVSPPGLVGTSRIGPFILQLLYQTQASPITLATGVEAQLIVAEHQQRTGGPWLATLNALRATMPGLAPLVDPGTPAAEQNLLFHERAFWMYLTGHRLGDMRRLIRQYGRNANTVFPIGIDVNGSPYGPDVNFEISDDEANNPNFHGCLNRSA